MIKILLKVLKFWTVLIARVMIYLKNQLNFQILKIICIQMVIFEIR